ncbi:hypothetical protein IT417_01880 [bacterium]|nr:hypothetical protein [bacterium]
MKATAVRKMEESAIRKELVKLYEDLKQSVEDTRLGKEKDSQKSLKIKRNIARMLTVLREMNLKK